jgi:hypothetical protein
MLFATGRSTRRLLLPGDEVHPDRTGKIFPEAGELPEEYLPLLAWARERYERSRGETSVSATGYDQRFPQDSRHSSTYTMEEKKADSMPFGGLLRARGIGAEMATGIDPDDYLRELREGWE